MYHLSIISPTRIRFPTSLCWRQVGVRGQLWVWWVPFIRWRRMVCWTLCSTWEEFLGQHGNNNHTYTHKVEFLYEWELNRWMADGWWTAISDVPLRKALDLERKKSLTIGLNCMMLVFNPESYFMAFLFHCVERLHESYLSRVECDMQYSGINCYMEYLKANWLRRKQCVNTLVMIKPCICIYSDIVWKLWVAIVAIFLILLSWVTSFCWAHYA